MPRLTTAGEMPATIETQDGVTGWKLPGGAFYPMIGGGETDAAATGEGAQGGATSQAAAGVNGTGTQEPDEFDRERAMATIKKLREFERSTRSQLKELEDLRAAQRAAEDAKLGDNERANRRAAELEQTIAAQKAETDARIAATEAEREAARADAAAERRARKVLRIASTLGAIDPEDANILAAVASIDPASDKAETDLQKAIETLKTNKPYLFRSTSGRVEPFNPGPAGNGESDAQRVARLRGQVQGGPSPFG